MRYLRRIVTVFKMLNEMAKLHEQEIVPVLEQKLPDGIKAYSYAKKYANNLVKVN